MIINDHQKHYDLPSMFSRFTALALSIDMLTDSLSNLI